MFDSLCMITLLCRCWCGMVAVLVLVRDVVDCAGLGIVQRVRA